MINYSSACKQKIWNGMVFLAIFFILHHDRLRANNTSSIIKYIIVFYLFQIFPISLWFAIIPILILMCALLAICNICWNYWHGKRPLTKISWFSTVSCRRTGKKNILDENYHGAYQVNGLHKLNSTYYFFSRYFVESKPCG